MRMSILVAAGDKEKTLTKEVDNVKGENDNTQILEKPPHREK